MREIARIALTVHVANSQSPAAPLVACCSCNDTSSTASVSREHKICLNAFCLRAYCT